MKDEHTIFDADSLPRRRIRVEADIAIHEPNYGRHLVHSKEKMARRIAQLVVESPDFFKMHGDGPIVKVFANVIVLTDDELRVMLREQFNAGLRHAQGFMVRMPEVA